MVIVDIDPLQKGVVRLRTAILEYSKKNGSFVLYTECTKLQASFYGRNFCWETFRPIFYKDKGLIQQFIKVCECSFMQKDR